MNKIEKISVAHIVQVLIKADSVIDGQEMQLLEELKENFHISDEAFCEARNITLADAINNIRKLDIREKEAIIKALHTFTIADGTLNKSEAFLLIAIEYCMNENLECSMISTQQLPPYEDTQLLYIESEYDEEVNKELQESYQQIHNVLRLTGFQFAYIPHIAKTYSETPTDLFMKVVRFLSPNISDDICKNVINRIINLTTATFCKEELCRKLGMEALRNTAPSLLLKISDEMVGNKSITNILKIETGKGIVKDIEQLCFRFTAYLNSEYHILKNLPNVKNKFIYTGVYKQIFDICLMPQNKRSTLSIDTLKMKIMFPEIGEELRLPKGSKALYMLFLLESLEGGINMGKVENATQAKNRLKNQQLLTNKFQKIYRMFDGDTDKTPDITDYSIFAPMKARINKALTELEDKLDNVDDYKIRRTPEGVYKVDIDSNQVFINNQKLDDYSGS